jgi:hypothetical protein
MQQFHFGITKLFAKDEVPGAKSWAYLQNQQAA